MPDLACPAWCQSSHKRITTPDPHVMPILRGDTSVTVEVMAWSLESTPKVFLQAEAELTAAQACEVARALLDAAERVSSLEVAAAAS